MKTMKKSIKIIIAASVVAVIAAAIFGITYLNRVNQYQNTVANITYSGVDFSTVPDGSYIGECDVDLIYAKTEVTVNNGIITSISLLEHRNDRGGAATGIEQLIVEQQLVDVDTVSGATNSSKVIKKAVDNALNDAINK